MKKIIRYLLLGICIHITIGFVNAKENKFFSIEPLQINQIITDNTSAGFVNDKLQVTITKTGVSYPGFRIYAPEEKWNLNIYERVGIEIQNIGTSAVTLSCWAVTDGWGGIGGYGIDGSNNGSTTITINPQETGIQYIYIHTRYEDNLHKMVDPEEIDYFDIRFKTNTAINSKIEIKSIFAEMDVTSGFYDKTGRLVVPPMEYQLPAAGKKVKQQIAEYNGTQVFHTLYLPTDWQSGKKYPVIVEYAPNIFYNASCYSTGKVEDVVNGYGISKGEGYILLSLPFISTKGNYNEVNGWGNADKTVDYALKTIRLICEDFGGDPAGIFITGFSRGAIAAGYIGLRNEKIADTWIGFNACQHTDGDGWNGSQIDADIRIARLKGRPVFLIDNGSYPWATMVPAAGSPLQMESSGIGAHLAANYLDDRPSTVKLRSWFDETYMNKPGTFQVSGVVADQYGKPLKDIRVETGSTHFIDTDEQGFYELKGLVGGTRSIRFINETLTPDTVEINLSKDTLVNFEMEVVEYSGIKAGEDGNIDILGNVVKDFLYLKSDIRFVSACIVAVTGKSVKIFNNNERSFNVSSLQTGIYFLKIISGNNIVLKRFLKI